MSDPHQALTLLAELDSRQDEVLDSLDELNEQVEQMIARLTAERKAELGQPVEDGPIAPRQEADVLHRLPEAA